MHSTALDPGTKLHFTQLDGKTQGRHFPSISDTLYVLLMHSRHLNIFWSLPGEAS